MPQLNKGGKFVFGFSVINDDLSLNVPPMAVGEYNISNENKVIIFSTNTQTGGFCVTTKNLLEKSELCHILEDLPKLKNFEIPMGSPIKYKGRSYAWLNISNGTIKLTDKILEEFEFKKNMKLLCIKGSNIAFVMGAKGVLLERANEYDGEIAVY